MWRFLSENNLKFYLSSDSLGLGANILSKGMKLSEMEASDRRRKRSEPWSRSLSFLLCQHDLGANLVSGLVHVEERPRATGVVGKGDTDVPPPLGTLLDQMELVDTNGSEAGGDLELELDGEGFVEGPVAELVGRGIELHLVEELVSNLLQSGDGDGVKQTNCDEGRVGVAVVVATVGRRQSGRRSLRGSQALPKLSNVCLDGGRTNLQMT